MKLLSFILLAGFGHMISAQCSIFGKSTLKIDEPEFYTPNIDAKCSTCYSWSVSGVDITKESATNERDIKLKGSAAGETTITVVVSTKLGDKKCSKIVKTTSEIFVPKGADADTPLTGAPCKIELISISETKPDENTIQFNLQSNGSKYSCNWIVTYKNGDKKESSQLVPQFPYYENNEIVSVSIDVRAGLCTSKMSKDYSPNFWPTVIPQKTYQQGSFKTYSEENKD